ncbi:MAG: hypothetical protein AB8F95_06685 [Bacteroidia bacterium]
MNPTRKLQQREYLLLSHLIQKAQHPIPQDWNKQIVVSEMDDGGMGSLLLFPSGEVAHNRKFGTRTSAYNFNDSDGIPVIASLNLDLNGELFELDIWKVNHEPLLQFPTTFSE